MGDGKDRNGVDVGAWAKQQAENTQDANTNAGSSVNVPGVGEGSPANSKLQL